MYPKFCLFIHFLVFAMQATLTESSVLQRLYVDNVPSNLSCSEWLCLSHFVNIPFVEFREYVLPNSICLKKL